MTASSSKPSRVGPAGLGANAPGAHPPGPDGQGALPPAEEHIPAAEVACIDRLVGRFRDESMRANPSGSMHRAAHAKMHGLVKAEFIVHPDLPPELRVGVFKAPQTFQAWVRFSNSDGRAKPDGDRDVRGMALKLMGVSGDKLAPHTSEFTQDFILISSPLFVSRDVPAFDALVQALFGGLAAKLWHLATHPHTLWLLLKVLRKHANLLQTRYFSGTPYLFGAHAVKYAATPRLQTPDALPGKADDDFLRQALVKQLQRGEAVFDFGVQFQTDTRAMPIENARCEWPETLSPFRKLATIRIPQQDCDSAAQRAFGENLSFAPWNCLPEHRPLGGINRARRVIYQALSEFRYDRNALPRKEPVGWDLG